MIKDQEEWVASIRDLSLLPDAPVAQSNGKWKVINRLAAWKAAGPRIFDDYLDRFQQLAVAVLAEQDPQLELAPEQRLGIRTEAKRLRHSESLRKGLAETLALLGSYPEYLTSITQGKPQTTATLAVRQILEDADWRVWASVSHYLPLLAEAAPREFLRQIEKALAGTNSPFREIYSQERSGIFGRNYMTGVLWALETLAWASDYLTQVVVLLGGLAAIDPGGNWANRPANSLGDILLPWHPQTLADISKRKAAVAALGREEPDIAWKLLLALLPSAQGVTTGTRKPAFQRFIPEGWEPTVHTTDYWDQVLAYAEMAVTIAIDDISKLVEIAEHIPSIPEPARGRLLDAIESASIRDLAEADREPLWEALAKLVSVHRLYADAEWAMDSAAVEKIEQVSKQIAPQSPPIRHRRLFSGADFELYEQRDDFEQEEKKLNLKRDSAVREILLQGGIDEVIQFAGNVAQAAQVGSSLGRTADEAVDSALLPTFLQNERYLDFVSAFVWTRFHANGWRWVESLPVAHWNQEQITTFLTMLPFSKATWNQAADLLREKKNLYWTRVNPNPYTAGEDLIEGVEHLLENRRPRAALHCLQSAIFRRTAVPVEVVVRTLRESLSSTETGSPPIQHSAVGALKWLQSNTGVDERELSQLEWSYLPLLNRVGSGAIPKTLGKRLATDPAFFSEVIRIVFRSDRSEDAPELDDTTKSMAANGFRLLREWQTPPGLGPEGTFDARQFSDWLDAVRLSTQKSGHFGVAMSQVGQVLPYAPPDPSGLWIQKVVAAALNAKDADDMRSGFTCELFNMRGTHGFTHGREERELAQKYRTMADAVDNEGYQRLASSLRDLAASYDAEAARDERQDPLSQ